MSTNYYHRTNCCGLCGRSDDAIHIGKSSHGWTFSFHGCRNPFDGEPVASWEDWKKRLRDGGRIFDEYDEEKDVEWFIAMVEGKKTEERNHTAYCRDPANNCVSHSESHCWLDGEGNSFCDTEFS